MQAKVHRGCVVGELVDGLVVMFPAMVTSPLCY